MRMAFGLIGVLVALGVLVLMYSHFFGSHTESVLQQGQKAKKEVEQIAGIGNGMKITDSITIEPQMIGSKVDNVMVTSIVAGGPMATYFGLKRDDCIVEANGLHLRDFDGEMAKAQVFESYQRKQPLVVLRDGEKITLPTAAAQNKSGGSNSDPIKNQLDAIQRIPTH